MSVDEQMFSLLQTLFTLDTFWGRCFDFCRRAASVISVRTEDKGELVSLSMLGDIRPDNIISGHGQWGIKGCVEILQSRHSPYNNRKQAMCRYRLLIWWVVLGRATKSLITKLFANDNFYWHRATNPKT